MWGGSRTRSEEHGTPWRETKHRRNEETRAQRNQEMTTTW